MPEYDNTTALLSVDMKKNRIRVFKSTLHKLGDPPYLQLLVNPLTSEVAVKAVQRSASKDQTHKVSRKRLESSNSVEIYSKIFIDKLNEVIPGINSENCYHMTGKIIPSEKIAVFSFRFLHSPEEGDMPCQI